MAGADGAAQGKDRRADGGEVSRRSLRFIRRGDGGRRAHAVRAYRGESARHGDVAAAICAGRRGAEQGGGCGERGEDDDDRAAGACVRAWVQGVGTPGEAPGIYLGAGDFEGYAGAQLDEVFGEVGRSPILTISGS